MAKLYWRVKRDGKWTWIAATGENTREIYRETNIQCDVECLVYHQHDEDKYCPFCKKGEDMSDYRRGIIQACPGCNDKLEAVINR